MVNDIRNSTLNMKIKNRLDRGKQSPEKEKYNLVNIDELKKTKKNYKIVTTVLQNCPSLSKQKDKCTQTNGHECFLAACIF